MFGNSEIALSADTLKQRLDATLSPKLAALGVRWRGDFNWVESGEASIRRVVSFCRLKGFAAVISWGLSLGFLPEVKNSGLAYHRTARSARLDIFDWPKSYRHSFVAPGPFAHIDCRPAGFQRSLESYFSEIAPEVTYWFQRVRSIDGIEQEAERQLHGSEPAYRLHHPSPAFVLAFIKAGRGDMMEAERLLSEVLGSTADADLMEQLALRLRRIRFAS